MEEKSLKTFLDFSIPYKTLSLYFDIYIYIYIVWAEYMDAYYLAMTTNNNNKQQQTTTNSSFFLCKTLMSTTQENCKCGGWVDVTIFYSCSHLEQTPTQIISLLPSFCFFHSNKKSMSWRKKHNWRRLWPWVLHF